MIMRYQVCWHRICRLKFLTKQKLIESYTRRNSLPMQTCSSHSKVDLEKPKCFVITLLVLRVFILLLPILYVLIEKYVYIGIYIL